MTKLQKYLNRQLPADYLSFIKYVKQNFTDGLISDRIYIYINEDDTIERYETFEMGEYLPDYLGIGNDSGGSELLISLTEDRSRIYFTDHGSYFEDCLNIIADNFDDFVNREFSLETIGYKIPRVFTEKVIARNELNDKLYKLNAELEMLKLKKASNEIALKDYLLQKRAIEEQMKQVG